MANPDPAPQPETRIDWESFYVNYRKPGYVPGYEILTKLGAGAFGIVFKARKESIGKDYAIKFLRVDDEAVREAVLREIDSVRWFAQVDHPNLVSVEDLGEVDGIPYIIMAYAGASTLRTRLDAGRLERGEALRIFVQVARGVQALHDRSLVHFDLKPANVYLKGDVARLGDYGLSKLVSRSHNSLSFGRGTPYYMAPEMLRRKGDHLSDVYSLGVMLFEMLAGHPPFRGDSEWEVLHQHETAEVVYPDSIAPADRLVIARCLEKEPGARYASVRDLLADLQGVAAVATAATTASPAPVATPDRAASTGASAADADPAFRAPHAARRNPLDHEPNTAAGHPRYSGRRFFATVTGISLSVFVLLGLFWSVSVPRSLVPHPSAHALQPLTRMRDVVVDAARRIEAPLRELAGGPQSLERRAEAYVAAMSRRTRDADRAAENLVQLGIGAVPVILERLLDLDLTDRDGVAYASRLDAVLAKIFGAGSDFRAQASGKQPTLETAQANARALARWAEMWEQRCVDGGTTHESKKR